MMSKLAAAFAAVSLCTGAHAMRHLAPAGNGTAAGNGTEAVDDPMDGCRVRAHWDVHLSAGWEPPSAVESVGTINGFMMFVDFSDAEAANGSTQSVYDALVPKADEWLRASSYGQLSLSVKADTAQIYRMPAPMREYEWPLGAEAHVRYTQDAVEAYLAADRSREMPVADVLYIVAPPTAHGFWNSLTGSFTAFARSDQFVATRAVATGMDVYIETGFKTLAHETGHTMGLPDLYPTDGQHALGHFVGGFSLMADSTEQWPDHFAWDKWRMGWLPDAAVDCVAARGASTTHVLAPVEDAPVPGTKQAVVVAHSDTSVLVAEVRVRRGVDAGPYCADADGVLLYTVDTRVPSGAGPVRVLYNAPDRWTCGGYLENRAALSFGEGRSSTLTHDEFGVTVTLLAQDPSGSYTIQVDYL